MDSIGEAIGAIFSFIIQVFLLLIEAALSVFMPSRRQALKGKWNNSLLQRIEIIVSITFLVIATASIIYLTLKVKSCSSGSSLSRSSEVSRSTANQDHSDVELQVDTSDDKHTSIKLKVPEDLKEKVKDKAVDYLKEKWKNRE